MGDTRKTYRAGLAGKAARLRYKQSPAGRATAKRYRDKHRKGPPRTESDRAARLKRADEKRFIGCDGEGAGKDLQGRQHYMLFRMGDRELWTGKPLLTLEILQFILSAPADDYYVGFSFGYDVTMILRDLPDDKLKDLIERKYQHSDTVWNGFGLNYLHKNYLRVSRIASGPGKPKSVPGSGRTIYETFGFFQKSFVVSATDFGAGIAEERAMIAATKDQRGKDDWTIGTLERDYCAVECRMLGEMMETFRANCINIRTDKLPKGLRPRTWNGAGKLASATHKAYGTLRAADLVAHRPGGVGTPPEVLAMAQTAYYGGRFEVTRIGRVPGPIYEYDLNSAYPSAMLRLPCLLHGEWRKVSPAWLRAAPPEALWLASFRFRHTVPAGGVANLYGLPVRQDRQPEPKNAGRLFWPNEGNGVYWSPEYQAARKLGCEATFHKTGGWAFETKCDCQPFAWVSELYAERKRLGSQTAGYPLKLAINALYGQLARRVGDNPPYANLIWAGLITALTRARMIDAAALDPDAIAMIATDGLLSTRKLELPIGDALGEWETKRYDDGVFIAQPGIYWGDRPTDDAKRRQKSRGISLAFFGRPGVTERFESAWQDFRDADRAAGKGGVAVFPPVVPLHVDLFIGTKLAVSRGKPQTSGRWITAVDNPDPANPNEGLPRMINMAWSGKRGGYRWESDGAVWTYPPAGGADVFTKPHRSDPGLIEGMDLSRLELDDQPDHLDLEPHAIGDQWH